MLERVHNIVLYCTDTDTSRAWYEGLGFEYKRGYDGMHWVAVGNTEIMLHPSKQGPGGAVPEIYIQVADIDGYFEQVKANGYEPVHHQAEGELTGPHTTPWGTREFELFDPDGHRWGFAAG